MAILKLKMAFAWYLNDLRDWHKLRESIYDPELMPAGRFFRLNTFMQMLVAMFTVAANPNEKIEDPLGFCKILLAEVKQMSEDMDTMPASWGVADLLENSLPIVLRQWNDTPTTLIDTFKEIIEFLDAVVQIIASTYEVRLKDYDALPRLDVSECLMNASNLAASIKTIVFTAGATTVR